MSRFRRRLGVEDTGDPTTEERPSKRFSGKSSRFAKSEVREGYAIKSPRLRGQSSPPPRGRFRVRKQPWEDAYTVRKSLRKLPVTLAGKVRTKLTFDEIKSRGYQDSYARHRWYYVGAVQICAVWVREPIPISTARYTLHINSVPGNAGLQFHTEKSLHEFIIRELERGYPINE